MPRCQIWLWRRILPLVGTAREGRLVRLLDISFPEGGFCLVRPEGLPESPAAAAFSAWLQQEMADFKASAAAA